MMQQFFDAQMDKFLRKQLDGENRSLTPWADHSWAFLRSRLAQEFREFLEDAPGPYEEDHSVSDAAADELLDIANFCGFLWLKWKGEQG